ncbi:MAG: hypothetical protein P1P77_07165 [Spirochaetaceae bacterium]|nr:hypothetical protein [Spirochaetaceae bacterium]
MTLVSRSGRTVSGTKAIAADALNYHDLLKALPEGSAVYVLVGLPYQRSVWRAQWPLLIKNIIQICAERRAFLLFFDNVYMYGPVNGAMTETAPHRPTSEKGKVRSQVADALLDAFSSGKVNGVIARSADFYGPGADLNGIPNLVILKRLMAEKSAQWIIDADKVHSLTYTPDCGRALPLLTADESSYNQVWHLPTAHPPMTMRRFAEIGTQARMSVLPMWMLKLAGLFDKTMRELPEMGYQNDRDYIFDSSKFERHFDFKPTSYKQGIRKTIDNYRQKKQH